MGGARFDLPPADPICLAQDGCGAYSQPRARQGRLVAAGLDGQPLSFEYAIRGPGAANRIPDATRRGRASLNTEIHSLVVRRSASRPISLISPNASVSLPLGTPG